MNVSELLQESEKSENFFKKIGRAFSTFQQNLYIVGFGQFTPGFPQFQHGFPHFNCGMMWKTCAKCEACAEQPGAAAFFAIRSKLCHMLFIFRAHAILVQRAAPPEVRCLPGQKRRPMA
jgi:hypothetical protein